MVKVEHIKSSAEFVEICQIQWHLKRHLATNFGTLHATKRPFHPVENAENCIKIDQ